MENNKPWHGVIVDMDSLPSVEVFLRQNGLDWVIGKEILPLSHPSLVNNEDILVDGVNIFDI